MTPFHAMRIARTTGDGTVDTFVVFLAENALPADRLSALVDIEVERNLVPDELVLVVRETTRAAATHAIASAPELEALRARLAPHATVTVVGFGADGRETGRERAIGGDPASTVSLGEVTRRAVTAIFTERGGFVDANADYHFKNPSGRHTDRFMRLSNLLVRHAEISMVALAVMPLVPRDVEEAHVDTPAMFSVVAAVNEHLRALAPARPALRCESFRSYAGLDRHDFAQAADGVVLISASSSGGMASAIATAGVAPDRIAHVLYLGPTNHVLNVAADLSHDADHNPDGVRNARETFDGSKCALCEAGSVAVPLKGDQFDLGAPEFEPVTIKRADAPETLAATMRRLAANKAFSVSLQPGPTGRQFRVDPTGLLSSADFLARLDYLIRRHVPAGVRECIVLDQASDPFARKVCARAGVHPSLVARSEMDGLREETLDGAGAPLDGAPILIAAAVIESGRALLDVSRDLRKIRPRSPQVYLVGLAKSAGAERRAELERTLVQTNQPGPHQFVAVEGLLLPPGASANAWTAERSFLDQHGRRAGGLSETLARRLETLGRASVPLVDDLFLPTAGNPLMLQPGFVFWTTVPDRHSQADVFFTISSVLQKLRTTPPEPGVRGLRSGWFQQSLLDPVNLGRFNDGVIQASLLRAARPTEIDYSGESGVRMDAARIVGRIVEGAHRPRGEAACEVLIALGTRRLKLPQETLDDVLRPRPTHPPLVAELVRLCRGALL